jgi:hypothetical protein
MYDVDAAGRALRKLFLSPNHSQFEWESLSQQERSRWRRHAQAFIACYEAEKAKEVPRLECEDLKARSINFGGSR